MGRPNLGGHVVLATLVDKTGLPIDGTTPLNVSASVSASIAAFQPKALASLAVSNVSSRVAFASADISCLIRNTGATDFFYALGDGTVVATTGGFLLKAGEAIVIDVTGYTYVAAITASSTSTLKAITGSGLSVLSQPGGSGGGGGGASTIADGADVAQGAVADAAYVSGDGTVISLLKGMFSKLGSLVTGTLVTNFPTAVSVNSGAKDNGTIRVAIATDNPQLTNALKVDGSATTQPVSAASLPLPTGAATETTVAAVNTVLGAKTDAKSTATDATSVSLMQVLKQVSASVQLMVFGAGTAAAAQRTTLASDDPAVATLGSTTGAAVITDANGTIQQYLRGLIKQWIAGTLVIGTGTNTIGNVGHGKTIKTATVNITADTDIIAAVTSKRIKVIAYALFKTGTNANPILFKSNGTGGTELARVLLQSQASAVFGANLSIPAPSFLFATVAGEKLTMDVGDADTITGFITYFDDDAT